MGFGQPDPRDKSDRALLPSIPLLAHGIHGEHHLRELSSTNFARGHVALQLRFYLQGPCSQGMPRLRGSTAHGPLLRLRQYRNAAGAFMKLTKRCTNLLRLLCAARWLTTGQIHRRFFANATVDAARKRLRKLAKGNYLVVKRPNRMTQALFALGREGRRALEKDRMDAISLERVPPKQLEHFVGINDLRLTLEQQPNLSYFFACWELASIGWRHSLIPDAVFSLNQQTFAFEFDRGQESIQFFIKSKIQTYNQGLSGVPIAAVIIVTESENRMRSLMKAVPLGRLPILFGTLDLICEQGMDKPVFFDTTGRQTSLVEVSSQALLTKREAK